MYLVDTSVMIDVLKGSDTEATRFFRYLIDRKVPYGISIYTYLEVLQGVREGKDSDACC